MLRIGKHIQTLIEKNDTIIRDIVCMWDNYGLDLPSYNLRKRLLEISERNAEASIALQGDVIHIKKLKETMPQ